MTQVTRLANGAASARTPLRLAGLTLLAWVAMLALDFFLHAGLLARFYVEAHAALLPPQAAFRLIPVGYLGMLVTAGLLLWLMLRLGVAGGRAGFAFGLQLGGLVQAASTLGLLSVTTIPPLLLLGWGLGQALQAAVAGALLGAGLGGRRLAHLAGLAVGLLFVCVVVTAVMQSLGLAPAVRLNAPGG